MVYVFLADGFETIEALAVVDMLRRAKIDNETVGVTGKTVKSSHNIEVVADITIDELNILRYALRENPQLFSAKSFLKKSESH